MARFEEIIIKLDREAFMTQKIERIWTSAHFLPGLENLSDVNHWSFYLQIKGSGDSFHMNMTPNPSYNMKGQVNIAEKSYTQSNRAVQSAAKGMTLNPDVTGRRIIECRTYASKRSLPLSLPRH
jgi:hypothetical protein